ncbi:MAG: hypothetical protein KatS3mg015_2896 [Fimbriimonadales bacterium]|nr:MAG: hypothetical protein KatS3mg015_2896 [Fimbriimonadales bacterium]
MSTTTAWDIIRYTNHRDGQALGYDDPADIGQYHVQRDGQWRSSHETLDDAVAWLSAELGVEVRVRPTVGYTGEERWVVALPHREADLRYADLLREVRQ